MVGNLCVEEPFVFRAFLDRDRSSDDIAFVDRELLFAEEARLFPVGGLLIWTGGQFDGSVASVEPTVEPNHERLEEGLVTISSRSQRRVAKPYRWIRWFRSKRFIFAKCFISNVGKKFRHGNTKY